MRRRTRELWAEQDQHQGDRWRLFAAVHRALTVESALYPGSFVDIAPSFVFPKVTYVDMDARAATFFADEGGVREIVSEHPGGPPDPTLHFIPADYTQPLDLPVPYDLLISLYAGFVSAHCTQYLEIGGTLLANPSHGDVAMASIDPCYQLSGVVVARSGDYRVSIKDLDSYLVPKRPVDITKERLHATGRGIAYTRSPFAYLFRRIR